MSDEVALAEWLNWTYQLAWVPWAGHLHPTAHCLQLMPSEQFTERDRALAEAELARRVPCARFEVVLADASDPRWHQGMQRSTFSWYQHIAVEPT